MNGTAKVRVKALIEVELRYADLAANLKEMATQGLRSSKRALEELVEDSRNPQISLVQCELAGITLTATGWSGAEVEDIGQALPPTVADTP